VEGITGEGLDLYYIIRLPRRKMLFAIRRAILMCGLVGTYVAAAVIPQVPAPEDGGPIPVCPTCHPPTVK